MSIPSSYEQQLRQHYGGGVQRATTSTFSSKEAYRWAPTAAKKTKSAGNMPEPKQEKQEATASAAPPAPAAAAAPKQDAVAPSSVGLVNRVSSTYSKVRSMAQAKVTAIIVFAQAQMDIAKATVSDYAARTTAGAKAAKESVETRLQQVKAAVSSQYTNAVAEVRARIADVSGAAAAVQTAAMTQYQAVKAHSMKGLELAQWTYSHPKDAATNVQKMLSETAEWARTTTVEKVSSITSATKTIVATKAAEVKELATTVVGVATTQAGKAVETTKWAVTHPKQAASAAVESTKELALATRKQAVDMVVALRSSIVTTYSSYKIYTLDTVASFQAKAIESYGFVKDAASTKSKEAAEAVTKAVEVTKTMASDPKNQATAASAVAGGAALGASGGAAGFVTGGVVGGVIGVAPALFTFGLSIPIGAAIGASVGTTVGAVGGGVVGAVTGGAAGRGVYERKDDIKDGASNTWSKAVECTAAVRSSAVARAAQVRERVIPSKA